jgi:hypothetical protein
MAVVAATIALDHHIRVLMTHTHLKQGVLEYVFSQTRAAAQAATSGGMDAIERLVQCGMLTPEGIRDHAESILKDRLELLSGSLNTEKHTAKLLLPHIFKDYRRFYDLLFVDLSAEDDPEVVSLVMEQADLVVVNLSQNQVSLNTYFETSGRSPVPGHKQVLYCLGAYERTARMNKERIIKQYRLGKSAVGIVPYHTGFMDAQNERRTVPFLLKAREARTRFLEYSEDGSFTAAVRGMGQLILQTLEISALPELEAAND